MPSTVYKGDLAEASFGHETGFELAHGDMNAISFTTGATNNDITITGASQTFFDGNSRLLYPENMLTGARLKIVGEGNYADDDYESTGNLYTITGNSIGATNTQFTITPALKTTNGTSSATGDSLIIDTFGVPSIDTAGTTYQGTGANTPEDADESVLTDQFLGLAGTVTLPETKVDVKRYHVVGVGRDVVVQAPGKFTQEGGNLEVALHSPRWLYYCLGQESVDGVVEGGTSTTLSTAAGAGDSFINVASTTTPRLPNTDTVPGVGDYVLIVDAGEGTNGDNLLPIAQYKEVDLAAVATSNLYFGGAGVADPHDTNFEATYRNEVRRITAVDATGGTNRYYLDDPLNFSHNIGLTVRFVSFEVGLSNGSPHMASNDDGVESTSIGTAGTGYTNGTYINVVTTGGSGTGATLDVTVSGGAVTAVAPNNPGTGYSTADTAANSNALIPDATTLGHTPGTVAEIDVDAIYDDADYGNIRNPTTRVLFSSWHIPSFALETSIRNRNVGAYDQELSDTENVPGDPSDAKTLTRVYRGCKVKDWTLSADTDAALKLGVNFDAAHCWTDTGRLHLVADSRGDRYTAHRMFENTANTAAARKEAGIAERTQKPYFFYNGTVTVAGIAVAQVTNFTLTGSTGVTYHHTVRSTPVAVTTGLGGLSTEQVPFGGSRNASLAVEGKEEFNLDMEVIVDDPIFWHQMRTTKEFFTETGPSSDSIRLNFLKQGAGITREEMTIWIDDYIISEAPLPIPEDKGVIRSMLKIMPKSVKVVSTDTLLHC